MATPIRLAPTSRPRMRWFVVESGSTTVIIRFSAPCHSGAALRGQPRAAVPTLINLQISSILTGPHRFSISDYVFVVFFDGAGEAVVALGVGYEIVVVALGWVHSSF